MGYTTYFTGSIDIEPPLNEDEISYLDDFTEARHMDNTGGPLDFAETQGAHSAKILDRNHPHHTMPGLWCKWAFTKDGESIEWSGREKFYNSVEWMQFLIDNLLSEKGRAYVKAWGTNDPRLKSFTFNHVLNGTIEADGEEENDIWTLFVEDNEVTTQTKDF